MPAVEKDRASAGTIDFFERCELVIAKKFKMPNFDICEDVSPVV